MNIKIGIKSLPLLSFLLVSCGTLGIELETPSPTVEPVPSPLITPTADVPPPTPSPTIVPKPSSTPTPEPDGSQYWAVYQDPGLGFRFAIPCFWQVEFPAEEMYEVGSGPSYHATNYTEEYVFSFPRSQIPPENGAIKVNFGVNNIQSSGLPPASSLREFLIQWQEYTGEETEVLEIVDEEINGQPAISTIIHYVESDLTTRYYLIKINDEFFLRFSVSPSPKILNTPDLEGILNSITIDPDAEVKLPTHTPSAPPVGLTAPCIPEYAEAVIPTVEIPAGNTECGLDSFKTLETLTETVQQYLQDRNTGGLRWEYLIHDPMLIGYWLSEGAVRTANEFANELANSLYAAGDPGGMTFTTDRGEFPPLAGIPPEKLFDPAINFVEIIYSEGWGQDQQGAAILYFAQDECDGYYWYGLAISHNTHFDK